MRRVAAGILPAGLVLSFWLAERPAQHEDPLPPSAPRAPTGEPRPKSPKPVGKERLAGRVIGLHGEGLPGLSVVMAPEEGGEPVAETRTLADGTFDLPGLMAGLYRVRVSGRGVVRSEVHRVAAPAAHVAVVVSRAVTIAGVVTDGGIPAPGAAVEVSG